MPKEYIERGALIENLNKFAPEHYNALINMLITKQPTADVVEVRHGIWLTKEYQYGEDGVSDEWIEKPAEQGDYAYCSLCLKDALLNGGGDYVLSDCCPHCGAKMDGKDK